MLPHDGLWPTNQVWGRLVWLGARKAARGAGCVGAVWWGWGEGGGGTAAAAIIAVQLECSAAPLPAMLCCDPYVHACLPRSVHILRTSLKVPRPPRPLLRVCCVQATVRIEPLAVEIGEIPLLRQSVGVLNTAVRCVLPRTSCAAACSRPWSCYCCASL